MSPYLGLNENIRIAISRLAMTRSIISGEIVSW
jgi:hypothetical protein